MAFNSYLLPTFGGGATGNPNSFTANATPSFSPTTPTPTPLPVGNVSARSVGTGFGTVGPDFSGLSASQLNGIMNDLGRLTYSLDAGGYRFGDANYKGNLAAWHGSDPRANQLASNVYGAIGNLPTRTYGSLALERLYQTTGQKPAQGPSTTSILGQPYKGPWEMPGYKF